MIVACRVCGRPYIPQVGACICGERQKQDAQNAPPPTNPLWVRAHWNELHRQAEPTPEWFDAWQRRIPNINCDCRRHWRELVEQSPPDFSSREAFFAWTVAAHNAVNQRLGKAIVTLEEARRLHAEAGRVE